MDEIVLSTGRRLQANRGIIGISASEPDVLFDGYDGHLETEPGGDFTPAERHELAERMVGLWRAWAARGGARSSATGGATPDLAEAAARAVEVWNGWQLRDLAAPHELRVVRAHEPARLRPRGRNGCATAARSGARERRRARSAGNLSGAAPF